MKLRAIPPQTAMKRCHRLRALRLGNPERNASWQPYIHQKTKRPLGILTKRAVAVEVAWNIDRLTTEIAQWLPELGEDSLLKLYEERARWAEIRL